VKRRSDQATVWLTAGALLPFVGVLSFYVVQYVPFLSDDSLISLRYARRLLDGAGLTWTDGHRVEGYSNLLWILAVAFVGRIGVDLIDAARFLGVLSTVTVMFSLAWWNFRRAAFLSPGLSAGWIPAIVGLSFLAFAQPMAVWSIGGLEQPLLCALLALSIPLSFQLLDRNGPEGHRARWLSLTLGLLCLTRPDGIIFPAVIMVTLLLTGWMSSRTGVVRHVLIVAAGPAICFGGQMIFRLAYYGEWVPNTALVKIAGSATHRAFGWDYLASGFWALFPMSAIALASLALLVAIPTSRNRGIVLTAIAVVWSVYVVFVGGDIFPAYRHLTALIVVLAFALAEAAWLLTAALRARRFVLAGVSVIVLAAFIPYVRGQGEDKWIKRAMTERWEWEARDLALLLKEVFGKEQPVIAVTAAGSLPYWSELPALDMMGLNDYYLPRHRPADFGKGMVGHELGDGQYVLDQKPDIIIFDVGAPNPSWRTGDQLKALPDFGDRYSPVRVRSEPSGVTAVLFVAKDSSRIGIKRTNERIEIPGFLFTDTETIAWKTNGGLVPRLAGGHSVTLRLTVEPENDWTVDRSTGDLVGIDTDLKRDGRTLSITLRSNRTAPVEIRRVVLTRTP
jgi:arabinofuranosyltransferase